MFVLCDRKSIPDKWREKRALNEAEVCQMMCTELGTTERAHGSNNNQGSREGIDLVGRNQ